MISNYLYPKQLYRFLILLLVWISCASLFNHFSLEGVKHSQTCAYEWLSELQDDFVEQDKKLILPTKGWFSIASSVHHNILRAIPEYLARSPPLFSN